MDSGPYMFIGFPPSPPVLVAQRRAGPASLSANPVRNIMMPRTTLDSWHRDRSSGAHSTAENALGLWADARGNLRSRDKDFEAGRTQTVAEVDDQEGMFLFDEEMGSPDDGFDLLEDNSNEESELPGLELGNDVAERIVRSAGFNVVPKHLRGKDGLVGENSGEDAVPQNTNPSTGELVATESSTSTKHSLNSDLLLDFWRKGHVAVRGLLEGKDVQGLGVAVRAAYECQLLEAYRHTIEAHLSPEAAASVRTVEDAEQVLEESEVIIPFLQLFNLHTSVSEVARIAKSARLGRIAADLLGVDTVRLYQDTTFWKRPGDGPTPWHADLKMAPIDTNDFVTFFIPLRALPAGRHAPSLRYATGSHRDFSVAYWYDIRTNDSVDLSERYVEESHGALALGDALAHHGWTLHSSPGVPAGSRGRFALSISYVSADARVLPRSQQKLINTEDSRSYAQWIGKVKSGKRLRHDLLPIVYSRGTGA